MKKLSLFLIALAILLVACKPEIEKPAVVTKSVGEVTKTSAKVVGQVAADGGAEVTERGICWSTDGTPTILDFRVKDTEGGLGNYEIVFTDLVPNTQYYVRTYATNEAGTGYGDEKTFTTLGDEPEEPGTGDGDEDEGNDEGEEPAVSTIVLTADKTNILNDGKDNIIFTVTENDVDITTSCKIYVGDTKLRLNVFTSTEVGTYTAYAMKGEVKSNEITVTVEEPGTGDEEPGTGDGDEDENEDPEAPIEPEKPVGPVVTTSEVAEITLYSAKCGGGVSDGGGAVVVERGVCWNTSGNPTVLDFTTKDGSGLGSYISSITGLEYGTTYYVRAYAANANGVAGYGKEVTFTTLDKLLPTVTTTSEVTDITVSSATCGGEVTFEGNVAVTAKGICWSTRQNPTIEDSKTTNGSGVGSYISNMTNLEHNTTYYVRAYATNEVGTAYGKEVSFTTIEKLLPTVTTTAEVTEITVGSASCGGEVTFEGNVAVTAKGICWSTSKNPTIEDSKTTNGSGVGSYTSKMTYLEHNTTYYVRAYATNEVGTAYGEEVSFTTLEKLLPTVTTAEVTDIKLFSAVCGGEVISGGDAVVVARGVCWNTSGTPTVSDTYTMDGTNIGSFVSSMKNLEHNTTYYVRAYATNAKGVTGYGEEVTFTTLDTLLPTVTTATEITGITVSSAKCGGEVTFNGNVTVTARGICWSTTQTPTIEDNKTNNGSGVGSYTSNMTNLEHNTTYYVRAYASNEKGTSYGEERTFTTLEFSNQTFTVNGVSFTMIAVEGGTFQMGATSGQGSDADSDERPVHSVTLSDYHIGETEVTQELWTAVMGNNPSYYSGNPQRPVEQVSWNNCQTFITKLNQLTGKNFRLPTEAEWEYAARGGNKSKGYKYSGSNTIDDVAWYYTSNSGSKTHDVKTKQANELGIYDMSGNVCEWCQDWYGSYSFIPQTDPTGPSSGSGRVFRGGSWSSGALHCRVSNRSYYSTTGSKGDHLGLRLCLSQY